MFKYHALYVSRCVAFLYIFVRNINSNFSEPGFYEDEKFGIRLENIVRIIPASVPYKFKDHKFLTFETITLVPIQTKMLLRNMLTDKEVS